MFDTVKQANPKKMYSQYDNKFLLFFSKKNKKKDITNSMLIDNISIEN